MDGLTQRTEHSYERRVAIRVSKVTLLTNLLLSAGKLLAGIFSHSGAMVSDAVHSASDVFSTLIVMVGVTIADKEADKQHPYGHERMECVAAIVLSVVLAATGAVIGVNGIQTVRQGSYDQLEIPGMIALIAAIVSIAVKEGMYWYTIFAANKINSGVLRADAWHHRSDAFSSVGALVGIIGARMGFPVLDSVASLVICLFILKASVDIFRDAVDKMVDKSCEDELLEEMRTLIRQQEGVLGVSILQTRMFGSKIYVDTEIEADASLSLVQAHEIAERVHDEIEGHFPNVKHCMVHVNPQGEE